ncbi:MAG TPA: signal recognition particle subunit SRP19/SEC65 family protein [Thermoplasmata archaeon]|nr:signal recognition particle subunit SRP19/SEC65 family protein [Thermoplasmata archaeon]
MPDHFYVYPSYLSRGRSREEGRRVPVDLTVPDLTAEEVLAAAQHLGYKATLEADKQYPRAAALFLGRIKVTKRGTTTKTAFLRALATELHRRRAAGGKK